MVVEVAVLVRDDRLLEHLGDLGLGDGHIAVVLLQHRDLVAVAVVKDGRQDRGIRLGDRYGRRQGQEDQRGEGGNGEGRRCADEGDDGQKQRTEDRLDDLPEQPHVRLSIAQRIPADGGTRRGGGTLSLSIDVDEHVVALRTHRKRAQTGTTPEERQMGAGPQVVAPSVPGTGDTTVLDQPVVDGIGEVAATVLDRHQLAVHVEHGDRGGPDPYRPPPIPGYLPARASQPPGHSRSRPSGPGRTGGVRPAPGRHVAQCGGRLSRRHPGRLRHRDGVRHHLAEAVGIRK